jgi:acyl-coenzyme A synthetase/AMP-(fatty) acid ligase
MHLSELIRDYFEQDDIYLYDGGAAVPVNAAKQHYDRLTAFLARDVEGPLGINLEFGYQYMLAVMACMRMGVPYVPLRTSWPHARTDEIVELVQIKTVLDQDKYNAVIENTEYTSAGQPDPKLLSPFSAAYIITTSGTTGKPKAVVIPREAIDNYYTWLAGYLSDISTQDRMLMITDFTFDISHVDICLLLHKRLHLHFSKFNQNLNIFTLAAEVGTHDISVINTVPNNLTLLLQDAIAKRANFTTLTHLILGGARFSTGTYSAVFGHFKNINVYNMYGPTEATVYSHVFKLDGDPSKDMLDNNVSIGTPIANMAACLVTANGQLIDEPNQVGHLYLSGIQLMSEYFRDKDKTDEVLVDVGGVRCYQTGDLAYRDDKGRYFVVGRIDDTIKRRGFRINLLDIDSYVQRLEAVQDSKTVALPSELHENVLVTFVIAARDVDNDELLNDLKQVLPAHQIPDRVRFIETFPLNNAGKVCGRTLIQMCDDIDA